MSRAERKTLRADRMKNVVFKVVKLLDVSIISRVHCGVYSVLRKGRNVEDCGIPIVVRAILAKKKHSLVKVADKFGLVVDEA